MAALGRLVGDSARLVGDCGVAVSNPLPRTRGLVMRRSTMCAGRPIPADHTYGMWCSVAKCWLHTMRTQVGAERSKRTGVWGTCDVVRRIRRQ